MTGGHGWVVPNPDGLLAKCGGPSLCAVCAAEKAQYDASRLMVADMIAPAVSDAQELKAHMQEVDAYCRAAASAARLRTSPGADYLAAKMRASVLASAKRLMGLSE